MDENESPTTEPTTEPPQATQEPQAPEAVEQAPEADVPAWVRALDEADPKELRKHPKFAGILGSELESNRRTWSERQAQQAAEKARKDAEAELERLAEEDPVAFAERFRVDRQQAKLRAELDGLKASTREELARNVGRAYQGVPEFVEFTEREYGELAKAVAGLPDDEVIGAWNAKALELVAAKRGEKIAAERVEQFKKAELPKEREAIRKELAKELREQTPSPGLDRPKATPAVNPLYADLLATRPGPEYDEKYDKWVAAGMPH